MRTWDMTGRSTEELVERVKAGSREAFDRIVERFRDRLAAFVRPRIGERLRERIQDEDVLQETFLKAYESLGRFRWEGEEPFFGWLCTIAHHALLRLARRYLKIEDLELHREIPDTGTSPSGALRRNERWKRFVEALDGLSPEHREVITLARIQGVPVREIARRMNRSPKAVYQLIWRALQKLRESFGETESFHLPDRQLGDGSPRHDE
jgi:RNA polymerase sigma-70 factor (ECF subfamily)